MADYTLTAKLTADSKGLQKGFGMAQEALANLKGKTESFGKDLKNIGKNISGVGDTLTRRITVPALAAATALTGITLVKGFNRLTGIDTAQAKLKGLGHDAKSVELIMSSALDAVRGTAFGMDEAATTAASAVAAGIKPGKELTKYLSLTGDAAAIAGDNLAGMGPIFNKIQTSNKAYNDSLGQLSDRGLPIYQWIAKEANVAEDAVFDMASKGEISSKMFLSAIESNIGGAAQIMGEASFTAAISNIGASLSRIGANFLDAGGEAGGFFSTIKPMLTDFNNSLGVVEEKAAELGVKFGNAFNNFITTMSDLKARFDGLSPSMQGIILKAVAIGAGILVGIGPALKIIGGLTTGVGTLVTVFSFLFSPIGLIVGAIIGLGVAFGIAMAKSEDFRNIVFGAFEVVKDIVSNVVSFISPILSNLFSSGIEGAKSFADGIGGKLLGAFELISSVVMTVVDVVGQFASSIVGGFKGAGGEVNSLSALFLGFNPVLKIALMVLTQFGPQIAEGFSQIASMAMPLLVMLGETLGQLAAAVIPMVMNVIATLIPIIITLGTSIMEIVMAVLPVLLELFMQLVPVVMSLVETVIGLVSQLLPLVSVVIDALVPFLMMLIDVILNIVQAVAPALIAIIGAVIAIFQAVIPVVMAILTTVINVMANVIAAIMPIIAFITGIITNIISIIAPIVTFIAGIIASIFNVITPIITFVSGVFGTVFSVVSGIFRSIMTFISSAIGTISNTIAKLSGTVSGIFNSIWSTVSSIMGRVSSRIQAVFTAITNSWTGLKTFVSGVFTGIGDSMGTLVDRVKGFVNGVIGGINSAIGLINKIPGVNISKIPQLQRGTDDWAGGFAFMNEGGRGEMVMLPSGSQVIPHDVSMKYAREAGRHQGYQTNQSSASAVNLSGIEQLLQRIYDKDQSLYVNDEQLAVVTNGAHDRINGTKVNLNERWDR